MSWRDPQSRHRRLPFAPSPALPDWKKFLPEGGDHRARLCSLVKGFAGKQTEPDVASFDLQGSHSKIIGRHPPIGGGATRRHQHHHHQSFAGLGIDDVYAGLTGFAA
jgi:hypothetical protein